MRLAVLVVAARRGGWHGSSGMGFRKLRKASSYFRVFVAESVAGRYRNTIVVVLFNLNSLGLGGHLQVLFKRDERGEGEPVS